MPGYENAQVICYKNSRTSIFVPYFYGKDKTHKYLISSTKKYMIYSAQVHRILRMRNDQPKV